MITFSTIQKFRFLTLAFFATCLAAGSFGQSVSSDWVRIESQAKDFSVSLPSSEFIVDVDDRDYRVIYNKGALKCSISMEKMRDAKEKFNKWSRDVYMDPKYQTFNSGDFYIRTSEDKSNENESEIYWFQMASSNGLYSVSLWVEKEALGLGGRVLRSMKLNGKQIVNVATIDPPENRTILVESLTTSNEVMTALRQPDSTNLELQVDLNDPGKLDPREKRTYSKHIEILRRPRAEYTQSSREKMVNGVVGLKINFLASGSIGSITLVKSLNKGLDKNAFEAAKKIKFIPAEINGKPVDSTVYFNYSFTIRDAPR